MLQRSSELKPLLVTKTKHKTKEESKTVEIKANILTLESDQEWRRRHVKHKRGRRKLTKSFYKHGDNSQTTIGLKEKFWLAKISTLLDLEIGLNMKPEKEQKCFEFRMYK